MKIFNRKKDKMRGKRKTKLELNLLNLTIITVSIGLIILSINITFFIDEPQIFTALNLIIAVISLGIPLLYKYNEYKKYKKIETTFPRFLRDITGGVNTGMTVTQAIRSAARNDYGEEFTPYAKEMAAKITWGIPLSKVFETFANKIGSPSIKRTVQTINEAHKSGGMIQTVLDAVVETTQELEKIKRERSASVYAQMINGYIIYFIFLGVMIGISSFLVPAFESGGAQSDIKDVLPEIFRNLVIIQGIFAGIAVGKMAEGTFLAGAKHSLVLTTIGYSVFILFI